MYLWKFQNIFVSELPYITWHYITLHYITLHYITITWHYCIAVVSLKAPTLTPDVPVNPQPLLSLTQHHFPSKIILVFTFVPPLQKFGHTHMRKIWVLKDFNWNNSWNRNFFKFELWHMLFSPFILLSSSWETAPYLLAHQLSVFDPTLINCNWIFLLKLLHCWQISDSFPTIRLNGQLLFTQRTDNLTI